jgi:hypothetical protein
MATNEILPFASTDTGTNLLTQAEYAADAQRPTGNQPGIARSKLVNKALRQASLLSAGLAEFIADYQANNVTDSLTPQNIADYLLAAIAANFPVVPDASTTAKGKIEIATAAEAQAYSSSLLAITPATMDQALKGANQSLASTGYQKMPGGLIVQWGSVDVAFEGQPGYRQTVTFPIAFPTIQPMVVVSTSNASGSDEHNVVQIFGSVNLSNVTFQNQWFGGGVVAGTTARWIAIGY